jgi:ApeA N-terminal domain 1
MQDFIFPINAKVWLGDSNENWFQAIINYDSKSGYIVSIFVLDSNSIDLTYYYNSLYKGEILMQGVTSDGQKITMVSCFNCGRGYTTNMDTMKFGIGSTHIFQFNYTIQGKHYLTFEDIKFDKMDIGFDVLDKWVSSKNSLTRKKEYINHCINESDSSIFPKFQEINLQEWLVNSRFKLSLCEKITLIQKDYEKVSEFKVSLFFRIESVGVGMFDLNTLLETKRLIALFLKFSTSGDSVNLTFMESFVYPELININFCKPEENHKEDDLVDTFSYLIPYDKFIDDIPQFFANFYKMNESEEPLKDVFSRYFESITNHTIPNSIRFINMIQVLESYHRIKRQINGKKISPETFKIIKEKFNYFKAELKNTNGINNESCNDFLDDIELRNEISLKERLASIKNELQLLNIELFTREKYSFTNEKGATIVVNTRNYLTHYSKGKIVLEKHLYKPCSYYLQFIFESLLLTDLGLSNEQITYLWNSGFYNFRRNHNWF